MREIKFRVWHRKEKKMYFRGYQKLFNVFLCEDDHGENQGRGKVVRKASYDDCEFLEGTGIEDKNGKEIFEGDRIRIYLENKVIEGTVNAIPDMFRSRKLHPLHDLLAQYGIDDGVQNLEMEVIGNRYEGLQALP